MDKVKVKRCIMNKSFDDLLTKLKGIQRKKVAVAVAQQFSHPTPTVNLRSWGLSCRWTRCDIPEVLPSKIMRRTSCPEQGVDAGRSTFDHDRKRIRSRACPR